MVYSKQIGAEENNGKARRAHVLRSQRPQSRSGGRAPAGSARLRARRARSGQESRREVAQTETAAALAWLALGSHSGHCPWALLTATLRPQHHPARRLSHSKGKNVSFSNWPSSRGRARVKSSGFPPKTLCLTSATRQKDQHGGSWLSRCDLEKQRSLSGPRSAHMQGGGDGHVCRLPQINVLGPLGGNKREGKDRRLRSSPSDIAVPGS